MAAFHRHRRAFGPAIANARTALSLAKEVIGWWSTFDYSLRLPKCMMQCELCVSLLITESIDEARHLVHEIIRTLSKHKHYWCDSVFVEYIFEICRVVSDKDRCV